MLTDWPRRARSSVLQQDLPVLGAAAENPISIPGLGRPSLYGALYVLERSRLGAKTLAPRALQHKSRRARAATRYLLHGEGDGLWPSFLSRLEADAAVREKIDEVIHGARATFAAFAYAMTHARLARNDNG